MARPATASFVAVLFRGVMVGNKPPPRTSSRRATKQCSTVRAGGASYVYAAVVGDWHAY
jgi:hypothetical protein